MQSAYWLFLLFGILLFVFPLQINIKFSYDAFKNRGILGFRLFFFKVWFSSFVIKNFGLTLTTRGKRKQLDVVVRKQDVVYIRRLIAQFRDKLGVKSMAIHCKVGLEDAFAGAMLAGLVQMSAGEFLAFIKNFKQSGTLKVKTKIEWQKKALKIRIDFAVSICLMDIIYCFLFAFIHTKRSCNYEQILKTKFGGRTFGYKH